MNETGPVVKMMRELWLVSYSVSAVSGQHAYGAGFKLFSSQEPRKERDSQVFKE